MVGMNINMDHWICMYDNTMLLVSVMKGGGRLCQLGEYIFIFLFIHPFQKVHNVVLEIYREMSYLFPFI